MVPEGKDCAAESISHAHSADMQAGDLTGTLCKLKPAYICMVQPSTPMAA